MQEGTHGKNIYQFRNISLENEGKNLTVLPLKSNLSWNGISNGHQVLLMIVLMKQVIKELAKTLTLKTACFKEDISML